MESNLYATFVIQFRRQSMGALLRFVWILGEEVTHLPICLLVQLITIMDTFNLYAKKYGCNMIPFKYKLKSKHLTICLEWAFLTLQSFSTSFTHHFSTCELERSSWIISSVWVYEKHQELIANCASGVIVVFRILSNI